MLSGAYWILYNAPVIFHRHLPYTPRLVPPNAVLQMQPIHFDRAIIQSLPLMASVCCHLGLRRAKHHVLLWESVPGLHRWRARLMADLVCGSLMIYGLR